MIYPTRLLFWADAFTASPSLILIKPKHANNHALIAHERVHQMQMIANGTFKFWRKYLFSKAFRQQVEVEAYRTQIAYGASALGCAVHLCSDYQLGLTLDEAIKLLEPA